MKAWRAFFIVMALVALGPVAGVRAAEMRVAQGVDLQKLADAVIALMGYSLTPDVTTGSLAVANEPTGNPNIETVSVGGGFTLSDAVPLYLEGTLGYSQYDPIFLVSDGLEQRSVESKWSNSSATGGVGWDFPLVEEVVLRPIVNFSFGRVRTDGSVVGFALEELTGEQIEFLQDGKLKTYGLGGTVMIDYEHCRSTSEVDAELRYTNIYLQSASDSASAVQGTSAAQSLSLWARWRIPTGLTALKKPVRYVFEGAHTEFLGELRGALGFNALSSLGLGLELDSSACDLLVRRTRLVLRYQFGGNVQGTSIGLAVSF